MRLHSLRRLLSTQCALIPCAAVCYAALFGFLIHALAIEARLDSWRRSSEQTAASMQRVTLTPFGANASCAERAGMGQKLCNAEANVAAERTAFPQRVAALKQRHVPPPADRVKSAPIPPVPAPIPPANLPEQAEPLNSSIAIRE